MHTHKKSPKTNHRGPRRSSSDELSRRNNFYAGRSLMMVFLLATLLVLVGCSTTPTVSESTYVDVTASELADLMTQEDVFLVDTHIPEQEHIRGTDVVIPYNEILARASELPKDAKIVLYCRSGSMSQAAAKELSQAGFTNVYNLLGGTNDWRTNGLPFE